MAHGKVTDDELATASDILRRALVGIIDEKKKKKNMVAEIARVKKTVGVDALRLVNILVPNIQSKFAEELYAAEHNLNVNANTHGHDMGDLDGNRYELKTSRCKKEGGYKCNVMWQLLGGTDWRQPTLDSIKEKVSPKGAAIIHIEDQRGKELAEYKLSRKFLLGYFGSLPEDTKSPINWGCKRCNTCGKYHRLARMQKFSDRMESGKIDPETFEWERLIHARKVKGNCGNA